MRNKIYQVEGYNRDIRPLAELGGHDQGFCSVGLFHGHKILAGIDALGTRYPQCCLCTELAKLVRRNGALERLPLLLKAFDGVPFWVGLVSAHLCSSVSGSFCCTSAWMMYICVVLQNLWHICGSLCTRISTKYTKCTRCVPSRHQELPFWAIT